MRTFYLRTLSGGLLNQRTLGANQAVYSKSFVDGPPSWQSLIAFAVLRCTSVRMIHVAEPVKDTGGYTRRAGTRPTGAGDRLS